MTAFIDLGYPVSIPYGDCERYDFVVDVNGQMLRIQCKTARIRYGGESFSIDCRRNNTHNYYQEGEVDYFATYYENKVYLLPAEKSMGDKSFRLAPITKPKRRVQWAEDYEIEKVLNKLEE